MNITVTPHEEIINSIQHLPIEILPELANFVAYLKFKNNLSDSYLPVTKNIESSLLAGIVSGESTPLDMVALKNKAQAVLNAECL